MKILLVEDEKELAKSINDFLIQEDFICDISPNYSDAEYKISFYEYDCAVIDIMLPDGSGLDLIRKIKSSNSKTGIVIISAKNSIDDKINGLEIGGDDYLTKPFNLSELNARIKSVIRRVNFDGNKQIQFNEITVIPEERIVKVYGLPIELTKKEYEIFIYFSSNKERVLTKENITEHVWGDDANSFDNFDFVYTHIKNLRKKLMDKGCKDYIKSVYGIGYRFSLK
jgi:DNA-binding response OmpR family regulator